MKKKAKNKKVSYKSLIIAIIVILIPVVILGYNFLNNNKNNSKSNEPKKDNSKITQLVFKDYVYDLSGSWKRFEDKKTDALIINSVGSVNGISTQMSAIIDVQKIAVTNYAGDNLFKDVKFFENILKDRSNFKFVGEGRYIEYGNTPIIAVPCEYGEDSKVMMVYLPAYEDYFYYIYFYSSKLINGKGEMFFNYDGLPNVFDFLSTRVKK